MGSPAGGDHAGARWVCREPPAARPACDAGGSRIAGETLPRGTCESAGRYVRLQQAEAASRVRDLESSLRALQALEDERSKLLRETAHDLRGSVGVLASTTALLAKPQVAGPARDHFHNLLQQRIQSMGALLTAISSSSRGSRRAESAEDRALRCRRAPARALRDAAARRGGTESLPEMQGTAVAAGGGRPAEAAENRAEPFAERAEGHEKRRHRRALVDDKEKSARQWVLSIGDTGPGFALQSAGPLRHALKRATDAAREAETGASANRPTRQRRRKDSDVLTAGSGSESATLPSGEGIGLSIVKRLCELLGATLELETAPDAVLRSGSYFPCATRRLPRIRARRSRRYHPTKIVAGCSMRSFSAWIIAAASKPSTNR